MGRKLDLFAKIKAMKYSFHLPIKLKIDTVTIAGCAKGNIIFQKHWIGPQPSIAAASSNEVLIPLKKVSRKKVVYGTEHAVYRNIRVK